MFDSNCYTSEESIVPLTSSAFIEEPKISGGPTEPSVGDESGFPPASNSFELNHNSCTFAGADHELQDAADFRFHKDKNCFLAAVADGVTHSFRPSTLAEKLVEIFTSDDSPKNRDEWKEAWNGIRSNWYKKYSPQFTTFHPLEQALFVDPGCHSTFHGVRMDWTEDGQVTVQAFRRGDAIALWVDDDGNLILSDPNVSFGNHPQTLGLEATDPDWEHFQVTYEALPARNLILATDALADFLLAKLSTADKTLVDRFLKFDRDTFGTYCHEAKDDGLKQDDYAYVVVQFANSVGVNPCAKPRSGWLLPPVAPNASVLIPETQITDSLDDQPKLDGPSEVQQTENQNNSLAMITDETAPVDRSVSRQEITDASD